MPLSRVEHSVLSWRERKWGFCLVFSSASCRVLLLFPRPVFPISDPVREQCSRVYYVGS